jgi:hypothetical protein
VPYLRRKLERGLDLVFGLVVLAAVIALAVGSIAFGMHAVRFVVTRLVGQPKAVIVGVRCHWHGRYLIARGTVVNLSGRDTTFHVQPDIAVAGAGSVSRNVVDYLAVRGDGTREWRWTSRYTGVPSGTTVMRCSATVSRPRRGEGDD